MHAVMLLIDHAITLAGRVLVSAWVAYRCVPSSRRGLRFALAVELVVLALIVPAVAGRLGLVSPLTGAFFGAVSVWNFALLCAAPFIVAIEIVARRAERRAAKRLAATPETDESVAISAATISRRDLLVQVAGGAAIATTTLPLAWGWAVTRLDFETTEVPIRIARLPRALDGFTLVQISDVHVGAYLGEHHLALAEQAIAALKPDLIAMTGDLVQHRAAYAPMAAAWLGRLRAHARHGVVMIPGNHEYYAGVERVLSPVRKAGVDVLVNEGRRIAEHDGGGFALIGVDDLASDVGPRPARALSPFPDEMSRILLCHQPSFHPQAAAFGFDLMLSGHTHGGQIAPVGPVIVNFGYRTIAGLADIDGTRLYVNRGFGTSGPPSRVSIRPEITKIVLVAG